MATFEKGDRKSTRLNSSHQIISYAVFCLKKKKNPISGIGIEHKMHNQRISGRTVVERVQALNRRLVLRVSAESVNRFRRYFFFNDTATTEIYTLSLHDALPI